MTEETEIVEPVQEAQVEQVEEQSQEQAPEVSKNDSQERNWNEVREIIKLQKQRIEELEAKHQQQAPQIREEQEVDDVQEAFKSLGIDKDDYLTADKAFALTEKIAEKKAEKRARQIVEEYVHQQNIVQDEQRMRSKYEDFDYVLENFAIPMIKNDPALAHKIQFSKNPAETAYKLAKISDEYQESNVKQQTSPKAEKILKNTSRPVSSNAVSSSLKGQAEDFSKYSPQQIWEMSQKYARGA